MPPKRVPLSCVGHTRPVLQIAYSGLTPDGYFIASASKDGKPMLRSGTTGDWIGTFEGHDGAVWGVDIDRAGMRVLSGSADFTSKLFDAATGKAIKTLQHPHIVKTVALSKDVNMAATACGDKKVRLWDLRTNDDGAVLGAHDNVIHRVLFSADGNRVFSASDDGVIKTFEGTASGPSINVGHPIKDLCHQADGKVVASCTTSIKGLNEKGTMVESSLDVPTPVNSAAVHLDEGMLLWAGEDQTVYVCNRDGTVQDTLVKHFGAVHCVRFAPDGQSFASCAEDGTLLLWQTHPGQAHGLWRPQPEEEGEGSSNNDAAG